MRLSRKLLLALLTRNSSQGPTFYVHSTTGNDSNDGLTPATALLTLTGAKTKLAGGDGTVKITSLNSSNPVEGWVSFTSGRVTLEGAGAAWYIARRATLSGANWADVGGGIYSRTTTANSARWTVSSLIDANGFQTRLRQNTATPSTPAAGEFGFVGTTLYVHLPGDASANVHVFRRGSTDYLIRAAGTCQMTVKDAIGWYSNANIFELASATASLTLIDCDADYADSSGVGDSVGNGGLNCTNVRARRCGNDGFNLNYGTTTLTNCTGSYNDDEGASPHGASVLNIVGGTFANNASSGMTAANNSTCNISGGAVFEANNQNPPSGETVFGGITYGSGSSGVIDGAISRNNLGPGFYCETTGVVTVLDLTSGEAEGNGAADTLCA